MIRQFLVAACALLWVASVSAENISSLLSRFQSDHTVEGKEAIIFEISQHHPEAAPQLLQIARSTTNLNTKWLAIRGLGYLKYRPAAQFLVASLNSPHHYVRANAARALGEMRASSANLELIKLLTTERNNGVIEQTTLALEMIKATDAVPVLKVRAKVVSNPQTRCWLIGGIAVLGTNKDVLFVANQLYEPNETVAMCAATGLQQLVGRDLHLGISSFGPFSPSVVVSKAKLWWAQNSSEWQ